MKEKLKKEENLSESNDSLYQKFTLKEFLNKVRNMDQKDFDKIKLTVFNSREQEHKKIQSVESDDEIKNTYYINIKFD